jgi:hypothetical protein
MHIYIYAIFIFFIYYNYFFYLSEVIIEIKNANLKKKNYFSLKLITCCDYKKNYKIFFL